MSAPSALPIDSLLDGVRLPRERAMRLIGLAEVMGFREQRADCARLCRMALAEAPEDGKVRARAFALLSSGVPGWHLALLRDTHRVNAYDAAIRRVVRPGDLVLDIGTGSGLLAMMAARAGAGLVVACEADPLLAELACDVVARNGFSDRVRIIAGNSRDLRVGTDLPRRADVVVSEILSNDLLGEGVFDSLEAARRDLLQPEAPAVPLGGVLRVALAYLPRAGRLAPVGDVAGFDLSSFNAVGGPSVALPPRLEVVLRSAPADLFTFDFSGHGVAKAEAATLRVPVTTSGRVDGVVQWIAVTLDAEGMLENAPNEAPSHWAQRFVRLAEPVEAQAGDVLLVHGWHDRTRVLIWAERT